MSALRIAILGCGYIARRHASLLRGMRPRVQLTFASRDSARAEAYRARYGGVLAFGSYAEACASAEVDAVLDCTPPSLHLENARAAAAHRKHLLVEKPVARSVAELDAIRAAVATAGIMAMVAENYRFKPALGVLRAHVERGDIGDLLLLEINRAHRGTLGGWRTDPEMMGGGALLEGGVHWVNFLVTLAGSEPVAALAVRPTKPYPAVAPFEDTLELLVRFADGAAGKLLHSWYLLNRLKGLGLSTLYGTEGNIVFETNGLFALVAGRRTRLRLPGLRDPMGARAMLEAFVGSVERGTPPLMSLDVARRDLAVIEAAYRSLESGRFEPTV
jgi:predicted dehydrogenase